ncbi:methyltransferase domain-containing protein [Streptomyces sp. NPDC006645]|uniref:class I SAM-dependent methyltransferase n=1 Tax=unclassified Streptomyces TaxID=2593676 RepID=UPI0033BDA0FD
MAWESFLDEEFRHMLRSPATGGPLEWAEPFILTDGDSLWPCIDGIPYLRLGHDELRAEATDAVRAGDVTHALTLLLADRKDASIPAADPVALRETVFTVTEGSATAASVMAGLGYGGLGTYFLHRWCQPTHLSGLALLEGHAPRYGTLFEVGCGAGHFMRPWLGRSGPAIGSDLVFSHLWLARLFAAPRARLVCFDAAGPFPLADDVVDVSFAHDSFHYFPDKPHAVAELKRVAKDDRVLIGHAHNADVENFSPGAPLTVDGYVEALAPRLCFNDAELTKSALYGIGADPVEPEKLYEAAALAFVHGAPVPAEPAGWLTGPRPGDVLRVNPLATPDGPRWPSEAFEREFVEDWLYLRDLAHPAAETVAAALAGAGDRDPLVERLAMRRALLDLPDRWL